MAKRSRQHYPFDAISKLHTVVQNCTELYPLTSLGPSLSTDTQLLLECLSDAEKSQIGQALGVALRSLVDLRQNSTRSIDQELKSSFLAFG
jgi:hypothetical protein